MRNLLFTFLCLVVFFTKGFSQKTFADSLHIMLKNASYDTARCWILNDIGEQVFGRYPDSSVWYWNQSLALIEKALKKSPDQKSRVAFLNCKAQMYKNFGYYYQNKGQSDTALKYFEQDLELNRSTGNKVEIATAYTNIGRVYALTGRISEALDQYRTALKMLERMDAPDALALCLVDIGSVYAEQNETRTALQHFERARDLYKQLNYQEEEAMALSHCANIYNRSGDPDCKLSPAECARAGKIKALDDLLLALDMWTKTKQDGGVAGAAANIAMIYRDLGNLEEAHRYAQLSLQVSEKLNFNLGLVRAERTYADIVLLEGKTKEAETYAMRSLQLSKQMGLPDAIMSAALVLKKVYEKQHNYKAALEMQELYTRMNDSINNESTRKESIKTQFRIAYERQAEKDSVANAVRITEEQLKSEQKIAEQRTYTIAGIIGFLLMLAVAVISLRAYRAKRKANRRITEQNEQIAMNNKDLERQHLLNQKIFSVISHDFRGPILSLNMVLDKFKSSSDDPKLNRYLSDTGTAVRNANEVLNNLLNWAKTEISISGVDKTEVKVRSIVSEIRKELAAKLEEKQLRIVENIPIDSMINLPPDILRIVLRNLVSNAIKFSYAGNSIELSFDAAWQKLSVKDSGAGMSPETAAQLFRRQVNPEQGTHLEEGFGIGLYIVSELLYKYGFTISVTSSIGKGATFAVEPATAK